MPQFKQLPDYPRHSAIAADDEALKWVKTHITAENAEGAEEFKMSKRHSGIYVRPFFLCVLCDLCGSRCLKAGVGLNAG